MIAFADPLPSILDYQGKLRGYLSKHVPAADLDDAVQLTLIEAWKSSDGYDVAKGSLPAWLFTIAWRVAYHLRRKRRPTTSLELDWFPAEPTEPHLDAREQAAKLLDSLLAEDRQLVEMRYQQGMPWAEIAAETGRSERTARDRVSRIRTQLKGQVNV